jgi:hypothetical protein
MALFIFEYCREDTASQTGNHAALPAEMLFTRCANAQRNLSFITLPVAFNGSCSRNSTNRGTLNPGGLQP